MGVRDPLDFGCVDCGENVSDLDEYAYMVSDAVWAAAGLEPNDGKLCIGCIEQRLGRTLVASDFRPNTFPDVGWNALPKSARLRARLVS